MENPHELKRIEEVENPSDDFKRRNCLEWYDVGHGHWHIIFLKACTFSCIVELALGIAIAVAIAIHNIPEGIAYQCLFLCHRR
jgi:ZIP family zinc transporter